MRFTVQLEVVYQFFVGTFDETGTYVDEFHVVASSYILSYSGFWFDALTSVPWSYLDLYSYRVSRKNEMNFFSTPFFTFSQLSIHHRFFHNEDSKIEENGVRKLHYRC
jgi:hypothetical protein